MARTIAAEYFDAETADRTRAALLERLGSGRYDQPATAADFARFVTRDLFELTHDKHLTLNVVSPAPRPERGFAPAPTTREAAGRRLNFGVRKVEILDGNIGLLDITNLRGFRGDGAKRTGAHRNERQELGGRRGDARPEGCGIRRADGRAGARTCQGREMRFTAGCCRAAAVGVSVGAVVLLAAQTAPPTPTVRRFTQNPLITVASSPTLGGNVNGPTVIRVPSWIEHPLGRYYMYFANHMGDFVRLAYADALTGPWTIYEPGVLHARNTAFFREQPDPPDALDDFYTHVASPEIYLVRLPGERPGVPVLFDLRRTGDRCRRDRSPLRRRHSQFTIVD
jgi:hypothetical protein